MLIINHKKNLKEKAGSEEDEEYDVSRTPFDVLTYSCNYFGSSYVGRKEGAKKILNSAYKLPIIIEDSRNIVFLPTVSPEDKKCIWIALNKIKTISKVNLNKNSTLIEFKNGKSIIVNVSYKSLENQILRASRLESVVRNRKRMQYEKNVKF